MKTIQIGNKKVELYDSIEVLPIIRFHKFNKMVLIDAGVGSDLATFDNHIERILRFNKSKPEETAKELENLRQNVFFIQENISPKLLAFCVLVKSIDGKPCTDISDDALKVLHDEFLEIPQNELTAQIEAVKKKIDEDLNLYFPKQFDDSAVKEYYDQLRRRTLLILENITQGETEERNNEIEKLTNVLITHAKPLNFQGSESVEIAYDLQFEEMCLLLSQSVNVNPKGFTVLEYYSAYDFLKKQLKKKGSKRAT